MPVKKVIAYFMHEKEEGLVNTILSNKQNTQSYVIGDVDENGLKELQKQNIIVQVLGTKADDDDIGIKKVSRIRGFTNIHNPTTDIISHEESDAGFPAFFKFSIEGPLLEEYREQLKSHELEVTEFVPPNSYIIRLGSQKSFFDLKGLLFTKDITFYSSKDTGINVVKKLEKAIPPEQAEKEMLCFDILLHRAEDLQTVEQWLTQKGVAIAGAGGNKIRIYLLEDSPVRQEISENINVQSFDEYVPPKLHNDLARQIMGVDSLIPIPAIGLSYTGDGQIVGVADTGIDDTHPDFQNQIHLTPTAWGRPGDYSDKEGHGTHVAGSIVGNGAASNGQIKGTAPGAKVFFQSIMDGNDELKLPLQLQTLFQEAYNNGARIHNNSWGSSTSSRYTVNSVEVDDFVWKNKDMLLVFSAGNDGNAVNPVNVPAGFPDFLSIGSPASAKNVLTVGASRSTRTAGGYAAFSYGVVWPQFFPNPPLNSDNVSGNSNALACFSSRGPCDDFRIKPDVVAPGTDIASVKSSTASLSKFWGTYPGNKQYAIMGGTSMAAPIVAGCAAIVREYFQKKHNHSASAALVKAAIINGSKKLTGIDAVVQFADLPNYNQGYGMVDMTNTIPSPNNNFFLYWYDNYQNANEHFRFTGQRIRLQINLPSNTWLKICLAYTDFPGRALQNNLNLMLDYNPTNQKWTGNEKLPSLLKMPDTINNIEAIIIDNALAGQYTLQVSATNIVKGVQDFAIVITTGNLQTTINKI
jgi:subtilisin family serine protease